MSKDFDYSSISYSTFLHKELDAMWNSMLLPASFINPKQEKPAMTPAMTMDGLIEEVKLSVNPRSATVDVEALKKIFSSLAANGNLKIAPPPTAGQKAAKTKIGYDYLFGLITIGDSSTSVGFSGATAHLVENARKVFAEEIDRQVAVARRDAFKEAAQKIRLVPASSFNTAPFSDHATTADSKRLLGNLVESMI